MSAARPRSYNPIVRVGILTGGGDCPGLNAVLRAVVRKGERYHGDEIIGFADAWDGVRERRTIPLTIDAMRGSLPKGGTVLGTKRGSPYDHPDGVAEVHETFADMGLDGLIVVGGNGSLSIAYRLAVEEGLPDRRRPQDDRQRHRRHRHHVRVPHRRRDRHRGDRPPAHHRREPRPGDGRRGDGPSQRLDRGLRRHRRGRQRGADPGDPLRHRQGRRPPQPAPRARAATPRSSSWPRAPHRSPARSTWASGCTTSSGTCASAASPTSSPASSTNAPASRPAS